MGRVQFTRASRSERLSGALRASFRRGVGRVAAGERELWARSSFGLPPGSGAGPIASPAFSAAAGHWPRFAHLRRALWRPTAAALGGGSQAKENDVTSLYEGADSPEAERLLERVEAGEALDHAAKRSLPLGAKLRVQEAELAALWRMSPQQRLRAFWVGRLSAYQQGRWASAFPGEVPTIDDVPIFIAATLADICEARDLCEASAKLIGRYRAAYPSPPWS